MLLKTHPAAMLEATREVYKGALMSPEIRALSGEPFPEAALPEIIDQPLQEIRLPKYLSDGYSYQNAAARMNVSINMIHNTSAAFSKAASIPKNSSSQIS